MEPCKFDGWQIEIAKNQKEYLPIPAHIENSASVVITTCWKSSFWQRVMFLFTGKVYVQLMTFGKPLQPQKLSISNPVGGRQ